MIASAGLLVGTLDILAAFIMMLANKKDTLRPGHVLQQVSTIFW